MVDNSIDREKYMQTGDFLKSNHVLEIMTLGAITSITDSLPINCQISKKAPKLADLCCRSGLQKLHSCQIFYDKDLEGR